jgi:hypothetical protein
MAAEKQTKTVSVEGTFTLLSHVDKRLAVSSLIMIVKHHK